MAQFTPKLGLNDEFLMWVGRFYGAWSSAELTIEYMIHKLLRISRTQAHHLLAGMEVGRKIRLLENLFQRSGHPKKDVLIGCLRKLQNESLRNEITHSLIWSDEHSVTFTNRRFGQKYEAKEYKFTMIKFRMHVAAFIDNGRIFFEALEIDYDDLQAFGKAALRASRSSKRSSKPPKSKAWPMAATSPAMMAGRAAGGRERLSL
jgi:hypothetical protein